MFSDFTRLVSDKVVFAYLLDLFVLETYRGNGMGRLFVEAMLSNRNLQTVNWLLDTQDAHGIYKKCGVEVVGDPNRYMRKPSVGSH